jgi:hypothetical protein
MEIAFGSWDGYFYLVDNKLNDLPGWPIYSQRGYFSSPALADIDRDGVDEIFAGGENGYLYGWNLDGTNVTGYPIDLDYQIWASPLVIDNERIAVGGLEQFYMLDAAGNDVPGWPQPMPGWPDATAAYDGQIITVSTLTPGDPSQGWLCAWTVNGEVLPGFPITLTMDSDSSPAIVLAENGDTGIIVGDDAGYLHHVNLMGEPRAGFPVRVLGPDSGPTPTPHPPGGNIYSIEASPAVADLDGDGDFEIAVGSWDAYMYLWDFNGELLPGWPIKVGDQIISSAALVDLDGDDVLDIVVGSKDHHLYGWRVDGSLLPDFPFDLGAHVFSSPWIGDLDSDGRADIVVGADNGLHLLRNVGSLGRLGWPMFHANKQRTGYTQD